MEETESKRSRRGQVLLGVEGKRNGASATKADVCLWELIQRLILISIPIFQNIIEKLYILKDSTLLLHLRLIHCR